MTSKECNNLRTKQDYDLELEQILLDCCDSMENSDNSDLLTDIQSRIIFAKAYLHELKPIQTFLYFLASAKRDIPF